MSLWQKQADSAGLECLIGTPDEVTAWAGSDRAPQPRGARVQGSCGRGRGQGPQRRATRGDREGGAGTQGGEGQLDGKASDRGLWGGLLGVPQGYESLTPSFCLPTDRPCWLRPAPGWGLPPPEQELGVAWGGRGQRRHPAALRFRPGWRCGRREPGHQPPPRPGASLRPSTGQQVGLLQAVPKPPALGREGGRSERVCSRATLSPCCQARGACQPGLSVPPGGSVAAWPVPRVCGALQTCLAHAFGVLATRRLVHAGRRWPPRRGSVPLLWRLVRGSTRAWPTAFARSLPSPARTGTAGDVFVLRDLASHARHSSPRFRAGPVKMTGPARHCCP